MKIAVDAMGGDNGPAIVVEGAVAAVRELGASVILVGDSAAIEKELGRLGPTDAGLEVRHASQVVGMAETPSHALRRKRDSSLRVAAELVRDGKASAFISAGTTGAAMAISMFVIGVLRGIDRPAIAAVLPSLRGFTVLIDAGANITPKPWHLFQFAIMGHVYARDILGIERPRVGLLSIGEEEGKGNDLTREAYNLLRQLPLNFAGNVEGRDLYNGNVDVIVCDGFIGNVALKVSEGLVSAVRFLLKESLKSTISSQVGFLLSRRAFDDFKKRLDYAEYGGAPLLGLKGVCIVGHGSSNANAIKNAVRGAGGVFARRIKSQIEKRN